MAPLARIWNVIRIEASTIPTFRSLSSLAVASSCSAIAEPPYRTLDCIRAIQNTPSFPLSSRHTEYLHQQFFNREYRSRHILAFDIDLGSHTSPNAKILGPYRFVRRVAGRTVPMPPDSASARRNPVFDRLNLANCC